MKVVIVWNYVVAVALDPIETIKNSIMAQTDEITAGRDKEPHTYANSDGHELLDDLQKIKGDNEELKGDNNDLRKQGKEQGILQSPYQRAFVNYMHRRRYVLTMGLHWSSIPAPLC